MRANEREYGLKLSKLVLAERWQKLLPKGGLQASGFRVPCQIEVSNGMWFKEKKRRWEVGPGVRGGCHFNHVLSTPLLL